MQQSLPQSSKSPVMPFSEFLFALFRALDKEGVRYCILRNYEDFPISNIGRDIDFLIYPFDLPGVNRALHSIHGIRIVGYTERHYVASFFLTGVSTSLQAQALQIDFDLSLTWKGLPYLPTDAVLNAMISRPAGNSTFFVPSPVHEAIISLLASLLVGGWLNEKYLARVSQVFADNRNEVIASLLPQFGLYTARQLVDSVISGDYARIVSCVRSLRISLILCNLFRRPLHSALSIARHYGGELTLRYSPKTLHAVSIFGADFRGNTSVISTLMPLLNSMAVVVELHHISTTLSHEHQLWDTHSSLNCSNDAPRSWLASMACVIILLVNTWVTQLMERRNLTLHIYDGCYQDLSINAKKYRYAGPMWLMQLLGVLFPSPYLWILLDVPDNISQSGCHKFLTTETLRLRNSYRSFVKTRKRYIILDAGRPSAIVAEDARDAIIDALALCTAKQLRDRF